MQRIASLHAYDALDTIVISLLVREYPDYQTGEPSIALVRQFEIHSRGEPEPELWAGKILEALSESL